MVPSISIETWQWWMVMKAMVISIETWQVKGQLWQVRPGLPLSLSAWQVKSQLVPLGPGDLGARATWAEVGEMGLRLIHSEAARSVQIVSVQC
jgi:hypothetical protein